MEILSLCEAVQDIPPGAAKRHWILRVDCHCAGGSHWHGKVKLSESPLYLELDWRQTVDAPVQSVGIFRLDLNGLLRDAYIRTESKGSQFSDVRLRIFRVDDGSFYVQTNQHGPRLFLGRGVSSLKLKTNGKGSLEPGKQSLANKPGIVGISESIIQAVKMAIEAELFYEKVTNCGRKFGITGEVGEILACQALDLQLVKDPRSEGFDAVDAKGNRVQIKTRRGEKTDLPTDVGRLSRFSMHEFDYALMVILSRDYKLVEVWKAEYTTLAPIIIKHERRNPTIHQFKGIATRIYP